MVADSVTADQLALNTRVSMQDHQKRRRYYK